MKKLFKIFITLLMILCLFGCNGDKEEENVQTNFLADKNFINVYECLEGGHSEIKFNEDYTFKLFDYYLGGTVDFSGTYEVIENTVKLTVSKVGLGGFEEVIFNIINDETLSLQTELFDSFIGNVYVCCESIEDLEGAIDNQRVNVEDIIAGKTYHNEIDRFGNSSPAYIVFFPDGSFEMDERQNKEYIYIHGKWEASEYKIHCSVEESETDKIKEINFYIKDFEKLFLENDLLGSKEADIFTSEEVYLSPTESVYTINEFINASQKARGEFDASKITLKSDGTFTLDEINGMGTVQVNGMYTKEDGVLMFSNFDTTLNNSSQEKVSNFECRVIDDNTLELMRDLEGSKAGDCFSTSGELPLSYTPLYLVEKSLYVHEPIEGVSDEYLPSIELYSDGTFVVIENVYAGMGKYTGTYSEIGSIVVLEVKDNSSMQGFMGADVDKIALEQSSHGYILKTDLCMSAQGDEFILN